MLGANLGCISHGDVTVMLSQFRPGPEVIKLFPCSTQLSTKFILLINVEMPTIVGILTLISMINTTPERLNARNFFICRYFSFYEQLKFCAQLSWAWQKFYNLGPSFEVDIEIYEDKLGQSGNRILFSHIIILYNYDFNEVDIRIRIYLPEKVIIHRGR